MKHNRFHLNSPERQQFASLVRQSSQRIEPDPDELQAWLEQYAKDHELRLAEDLAIATNHLSNNNKIMEVGAVPPLLTLCLKQIGYDVTGIDIAPERFAGSIAKHQLVVHKCNIETERLPLSDNTFDAVIFNEVFEHLRINLVNTMQEMYRVLKPGGKIFLSTPNLRSCYGIKNFLLHNQSYSCIKGIYDEYLKLDKLGHMGHVREYTTTEVAEFLKCIGFKAEQIYYRGSYGKLTNRLLAKLNFKLLPMFTIIGTK